MSYSVNPINTKVITIKDVTNALNELADEYFTLIGKETLGMAGFNGVVDYMLHQIKTASNIGKVILEGVTKKLSIDIRTLLVVMFPEQSKRLGKV